MIRSSCKIFIAGALATAAMVGAASATPAYDTSLASPGFYAGSGNPNSGFTVNTQGGVELGLGVHYRYGASVSPSPTTGNVYTVMDGGQPCYSTTCALWNVDFSVNLQAGSNTGLHLSDITASMTVTDVGTSSSVSFDPLALFPDDYGWNGGPTDNTAANNLSTDWGFQNSENLAFFFPGFDPNKADTYNIALSVSSKAGTSLGSVSETINAVPEPGTLPLFAAGLGLLGMLGWWTKRKNVRASAAA